MTLDKRCETCTNFFPGSGCMCVQHEIRSGRESLFTLCSKWEPKRNLSVVNMTMWPMDEDWMECKRRALVTVGKIPIEPPTLSWKMNILNARHSPIRWLRFSFDIEAKSWLATHLARHVHAQPYILSQRDDRTGRTRDGRPQGELVNMILDVNAEELMNIANKRLCMKAHLETRLTVEEMCRQVVERCPEFEKVLVPMCLYRGGCGEMHCCGHEEEMRKKFEYVYGKPYADYPRDK